MPSGMFSRSFETIRSHLQHTVQNFAINIKVRTLKQNLGRAGTPRRLFTQGLNVLVFSRRESPRDTTISQSPFNEYFKRMAN
jgi:hypothetical protein